MRGIWRATRRRFLLGSAAAVAVHAPARGRDGPVTVASMSDGLLVRDGDTLTRVRVAAEGVATIIRCPAGKLDMSAGFFASDGVSLEIVEQGGRVRVTGPGIVIEVDRSSGRLRFLGADGRERLAEAATPAPIPGVAATRRQGFRIGATERLHGLGQYREPLFEYRDRDLFLAHANSDACNPMLVTTGGWGLLWDTGTAAHLRSRGPALDYHSVAGDVIRYHVCLGDGMDGVIAGYRRLTGAASLLPRWAYGYWQSKESYTPQGELVEAVRGYRRRRLPIDVVVLDYRYWGGAENFSGMRFDPATFPDPKAMVDAVHAEDVAIVASVWSAFGTATELYGEMGARGYLLPGTHWSGGKLFDVTDPDARALYWSAIKRGLIDIGTDGLWTDGNEPELRSTGERYGTMASYAANGPLSIGPPAEHLLTYSWYQSRGLSEAMRRDRPDRRPVILSRSVYAGQQAAGAILWSGDIFASWGTLANQVIAALNLSMSGYPWWTCDIGAFLVFHRYPDGLDDPAYRELYVRWFQFAAFLPVFRAHGTHVPRELWRFGAPGDTEYDALEAALRQRYLLMPYIYTLAANAALEGDTPLRALVMDFPDDPAAREATNAFMLGRDLLMQVIDRPLFHAPRNIQEFLPNHAVRGIGAPAATIEYFEGADFDRFVSKRLTDDIKMSWAGDLPAELSGKPHSLRWTGRLVAEETGPHRFSVIGKGAVRLMFDGRVVVDARAATAAADGATGAVSFRGHEGDAFHGFDADLVAGRAYEFRLEQRQEIPDAVSMWFEWVTPTIAARHRLTEVKSVAVTLPRGRDWYDFRTGARHAGGRTIDVPAPLATHPIFARAGAILPLSPGTDRTGPLPRTIELRVYAGHDGAFALYDDAGDGPGHLAGEAARIRFTWDDSRSRLTIGARQGRFPGMRAAHDFAVTLIDGSGAPRRRRVRWRGRERIVDFAVQRGAGDGASSESSPPRLR